VSSKQCIGRVWRRRGKPSLIVTPPWDTRPASTGHSWGSCALVAHASVDRPHPLARPAPTAHRHRPIRKACRERQAFVDGFGDRATRVWAESLSNADCRQRKAMFLRAKKDWGVWLAAARAFRRIAGRAPLRTTAPADGALMAGALPTPRPRNCVSNETKQGHPPPQSHKSADRSLRCHGTASFSATPKRCEVGEDTTQLDRAA
jgi:hypothetical protein